MSACVKLAPGPGGLAIAPAPVPWLETVTIQGVFRALERQQLPPLVTTALHGAIERALPGVDCEGVFRRPEVTAATRALGVTDVAPPAYVLSPGRAARFQPEVRWEFESGQLFDVEVTLLGRRAIAAAGVMVSALARVAELGLARVKPDGLRPSLELVHAEVQPSSGRVPSDRALLNLVTPLRLTFGGKVTSRVDSGILAAGLWRRAELLARVHGDGTASSQMPDPGSLVLRSANLERVEVFRYSHRQARQMRWPGLLGTIELAGVTPWWPVLELCQRAQVGKATSFGFGKFELVPLGPSMVEGER